MKTKISLLAGLFAAASATAASAQTSVSLAQPFKKNIEIPDSNSPDNNDFWSAPIAVGVQSDMIKIGSFSLNTQKDTTSPSHALSATIGTAEFSRKNGGVFHAEARHMKNLFGLDHAVFLAGGQITASNKNKPFSTWAQKSADTEGVAMIGAGPRLVSKYAGIVLTGNLQLSSLNDVFDGRGPLGIFPVPNLRDTTSRNYLMGRAEGWIGLGDRGGLQFQFDTNGYNKANINVRLREKFHLSGGISQYSIAGTTVGAGLTYNIVKEPKVAP